VNLRKLIKYMLRKQFQKWILFSFVALWFHLGMSQGINDIHKAYIIGQVTKTTNNGPIINQEIRIMSDSSYNPGFNYFKKVYTDKEGLFYDTIPTEAFKGALIIYMTQQFIIDLIGVKVMFYKQTLSYLLNYLLLLHRLILNMFKILQGTIIYHLPSMIFQMKIM